MLILVAEGIYQSSHLKHSQLFHEDLRLVIFNEQWKEVIVCSQIVQKYCEAHFSFWCTNFLARYVLLNVTILLIDMSRRLEIGNFAIRVDLLLRFSFTMKYSIRVTPLR
jgi:hypothetical protein